MQTIFIVGLTCDKETRISPERIWNSPTKKRIRTSANITITNLRKEIRMLKERLRKKNKKILTMDNILNKLKTEKLITRRQFKSLFMLGKVNKNEFEKLGISANISLPKVYSPELRSFALTLHYYSPHAYKYVRTHFKNCLPHPKTISAWYISINGSPGINIEALNCIKEKAALVDYPLFVCIIFDEMAIRKNIEFDGSKYYGYVDFGFNNTSNCVEPAKEVLVFLLVYLNQNWKIPIAYYFTNGVSACEKKTFITLYINIST